MQRERLKTAAASRDSLVGAAVGSTVGRAVASEENCARFNESQGVDKEPVPLTTGLTQAEKVELLGLAARLAESWCAPQESRPSRRRARADLRSSLLQL